jgi:putative transposase
MPRLARVVVPGVPHHVTQRGNRRLRTFFPHEDYEAYRELMAEWRRARGVRVWAYCLMPNHVHLIAVPEHADGLRLAIGEAHRRYTRRINFREGWRGHLRQGRFASFPMSEPHAFTCARYVELNPARARLVERPERWPYSNARAHLAAQDDALVSVAPLLDLVGEWSRLLQESPPLGPGTLLRQHRATGRPLGDSAFVTALERHLGRRLRRGRAGRPRRSARIDTRPQVRNPLIVIAGSGIVITDSGDRDHAVGAKRR